MVSEDDSLSVLDGGNSTHHLQVLFPKVADEQREMSTKVTERPRIVVIPLPMHVSHDNKACAWSNAAVPLAQE
jgi:hypothetical protein